MSRKSKITSPTSVEIVIIPNQEKVKEAIKIAAPGYRRALIKRLQEEDKN